MFSVIIPCDNRLGLLYNTIAAYYDLHNIGAYKRAGLEFIIVTRSAEIKEPPMGISRVIHYDYPGEECNPAMALNIGVRAAKNDHVIITCPEVMPISPVLDLFSKCLGNNVLAHVVEGDRVLLSSDSPSRNPGLYYLAMYSMETIKTLNGWDEDFMLGRGAEDTDFGIRFNRAGLTCHYRDDIKALHQVHPRNSNHEAEMKNYGTLARNNNLGIVQPPNGLVKLNG